MEKAALKLDDIPQFWKIFAYLVNQIGFPIVAFCTMIYICNTTLAKLTEAIHSNTVALGELKTSTESTKSVTLNESRRLQELVKNIERNKQ